MSATSAFLISVIAGVLGNRSDDLLYKSQNVVKRMFNNVQEPTNQEIQCAVRRAYLKATLLTCKSLKKNKYSSLILTPKYLSDISSYLRQQIKKLDKDKTFVPPSDFDSNFETLLQSKGVSAKDRLPEFILTLKQSILHSLEVPPFEVKEELKKYILKGWEEDGKHVDWYELMCAFFQEELKNNPHLSTIIQTNLLIKLNQDISELQLSLDAFVKPLRDFFEEHKNMLSILDEINEKVDRNFAAIKNLETKIDNAKVTEVIYTSAEYQQFQKSISRLQRLMELTDDMSEKLEYSKELNELQSQLEAFKRDIIKLAETFQNVNLDNKVINLAKQKYNEGKIKEAYSLLEAEQITNGLDVLLERNQKVQQDLKDKAEELLLFAQLTAVNYDLGEKRYKAAKECYEKSLTANEYFYNLGSYGHFLAIHNQFPLAIKYYKKSIDSYRKLVTNEESSKLKLAQKLNDIGIIYTQNNDFLEAELALNESIDIYQDLEKQIPDKYISKVSNLLNNTGNLYKKWGKLAEAEEAYNKSLKIGETLFEVDTQKRRSFIATLQNLGNLYTEKENYKKARELYDRALYINKIFSDEEAHIFLPQLMLILNNSANLYQIEEKLLEAEEDYKEALTIAKLFTEMNPEAYLPKYAKILANLGHNYRKRREIRDTKKSYQESIAIFKELSKINPQLYLPGLAGVLIGFSLFFVEVKNNREMSISLAEEAIDMLITLNEISRTGNHFKQIFEILQKWNIEPEDYIKQMIESSTTC